MKRFCFCCLVVLAAAVSSADTSVRRKFIARGWDTTNAMPEEILTNADAFAATGIDGISFYLPERKQADGGVVSSRNLPTDSAWTYETYADLVPVFRQIAAKPGLKESFVECAFTPMRGRIPWTDDAKWASWANNMGVLARLAREGGLRGLFLDNEDYRHRHQFELAEGEMDFDVAYTLARQRGREVFGAVYREFPDAVLVPFWLLSQVEGLIQSSDPIAAMRNSGSLWPAFVNGLFDILPPTGRVVDGCEKAYSYEWNDGSFANAVTAQLVGFLPLVAPENRAKYRAQLCVGFGLYLDSYINEDPRGTWYFKPINGSRLEHFRLNLTEAARCADEYVWFDGEKVSWVKWQGLGDRKRAYKTDVTWEEKLPGLASMLRDVKNPTAGMMDRIIALRAKGAAVNRFPEALARETHWQNPRCKPGTYAIDPKAGTGGTVTLTGIVNGSCNLPVDARPGETWIVDLYMSGSAGERETPSLCFIDAKGKMRWDLGTIVPTLIETDNIGRKRFAALLRVPENMSRINLMLNGAQHNNETAVFTDIFIARSDE